MYRVGIIGCGRPRKTEGATGFGIAHHHAAGYKACEDTEIVAVADIVRENAMAFASEHEVPNIYEDYQEMLEKENLDIVSVCLWISLHAPVVTDVATSGVKAIHCEKPMAPTFGEAKFMVESCEEEGVQLTFNHQRRFGPTFRKAKEIAHSGAIGEIRRLEGYCGDIFDWGTHWIDMMFFYNNDSPAEWVMGQIDSRTEREIFGVALENQAFCRIQWKNGVIGFLETGTENRRCANRIIGSDGMIEVGIPDGSPLRFMGKETCCWEEPELDGGLHGGDFFAAAILDLVDSLKTGREPELDGRKALRATEIIFSAYESSRRRARIDLPLDITDSPFLDMLERGLIGPNRHP